jgi:hypothetical protein
MPSISPVITFVHFFSQKASDKHVLSTKLRDAAGTSVVPFQENLFFDSKSAKGTPYSD